MTNQLLLPALLPAQPPPPTPACDCDGFCSGHCSLPTAAGPPSTLTLYRLTPTNITDLVNKDTGNAEGDAFFTLDEYDLPMRCAQGVSTNSRGCFLDVSDIYMAFEVEVDGLYGPYGHCNPPKQNSLVGNFSCRGMGHTTKNSSSYCVCPRTNTTVGRQTFSMQFGKYGNGFISKLSRLLDGYWYSTPELGECKGEHRPGDGSGCTWRVKAIQKVVNASCVERRVYSTIEAHNKACFDSCLPAGAAPVAGAVPNRSTACVNNCFQTAVVGSATAAQVELVPMTAAEILAPWGTAFGSDSPAAGGCPPCVWARTACTRARRRGDE